MTREQKSERLTFSLTLDEKLALLMLASEDGLSLAATMRRLIVAKAQAEGLWPPRPNPRIEVLREGEPKCPFCGHDMPLAESDLMVDGQPVCGLCAESKRRGVL